MDGEIYGTRPNVLFTLLNALFINTKEEAMFSYIYLWFFPLVKFRSILKIEYSMQPAKRGMIGILIHVC